MKDIADKVGITERSAQRIVSDLAAEGYITQAKTGRRNHYEVRLDLPLRHPIERQNQVGVLLKLLVSKAAESSPATPRKTLLRSPK